MTNLPTRQPCAVKAIDQAASSPPDVRDILLTGAQLRSPSVVVVARLSASKVLPREARGFCQKLCHARAWGRARLARLSHTGGGGGRCQGRSACWCACCACWDTCCPSLWLSRLGMGWRGGPRPGAGAAQPPAGCSCRRSAEPTARQRTGTKLGEESGRR